MVIVFSNYYVPVNPHQLMSSTLDLITFQVSECSIVYRVILEMTKHKSHLPLPGVIHAQALLDVDRPDCMCVFTQTVPKHVTLEVAKQSNQTALSNNWFCQYYII